MVYALSQSFEGGKRIDFQTIWFCSFLENVPEILLDDSLELPAATSELLPMFLEEPVDTYAMKNKPAVLYCRAAHALQVSFF